jgi:membrane associated rhomboid family serine protease
VIPYRDESRRFTGFPFVTVALIVANIAVFVHELALRRAGDAPLGRFVHALGITPYVITHHIQLPPPSPHPEYLTIFTAMFVHADVLHIAGNMLYLYIFGPAIEWMTGSVRFLIFYFACGAVAGLTQIMVYPDSRIVAIGASGAIAGVLGAFVLFFAGDTIDTILPIGCFPLFIQVPAIVFIGLWIVIQVLLAQTETASVGGIGYLEHIAGFVSGMALIWVLKARVPERRFG